MATLQKISPFLWFDGSMEEAVKLYVSIFRDSKITRMSPMTSSFELEGQEFMAQNGGPEFKFTEAVSFFVKCADEAEVDYYWSKLTANGGAESRCGWLKDRYGLSWQIIPDALGRYLGDADQAKSQRVLQAMMKMTKIIVADLEKAHAG